MRVEVKVHVASLGLTETVTHVRLPVAGWHGLDADMKRDAAGQVVRQVRPHAPHATIVIIDGDGIGDDLVVEGDWRLHPFVEARPGECLHTRGMSNSICGLAADHPVHARQLVPAGESGHVDV